MVLMCTHQKKKKQLTNYGIQIAIKCFLVWDDQRNLEASEKIAGRDFC